MKENWIFPGNVKLFDIPDFIQKNGYIVWKRTTSMNEGDIVYIYLGAPYSQIKFKCYIEDPDLRQEIVDKNDYAIPRNVTSKTRYVLLKPLLEFPDGSLPLSKLKNVGLGQVQIQARVDRKLLKYLNDYEMSLNEEDRDETH